MKTFLIALATTAASATFAQQQTTTGTTSNPEPVNQVITPEKIKVEKVSNASKMNVAPMPKRELPVENREETPSKKEEEVIND